MPKQLAVGLVFGQWLSVPVPDIERTQLLVILGGNPMVSNGSMWTVPDFRGKAKAMQARGGRLVVIDACPATRCSAASPSRCSRCEARRDLRPDPLYARAVRVPAWSLAILIAGCHPSATVERTMPVANLQSYRTVALNVRSTAFASQGQAMFLEAAVVDKLRQQCQFDQIVRPGAAPADVMLDLNITNVARGGGGWVTNSNTAIVDTLLVLSDGQNGELLGTARIKGKSSGMIINNSVPEREAIDAVAKSVADLLAKSGCSGPRVARSEPAEPPPTHTGQGAGSGSGSGSAPDESRRAEAETLNEQGKEKLRGADIPGALAAFQQANALVPDARYQYNVCLAFEAGEQWSNAIAACKQARAMNPEPRLLAKIDRRIELIQQHH
jgi:hypothetical protein